MKKILYLLIFISLSGCYELDTKPYHLVSAGSFWKTEEHALQGLMGVYDDMKDNNAYGLYFMFDNLSDIALGYDGQGLGDIITGNFTDRTGIVVNRWRRGFDGVQRSNTAIMKISGMDIPEESKKAFIAEARFMRALYYNYLMNLFGGLPLYNETVDLNKDFNKLLLPRNTEAEVRAFILADLSAAIAGLPVAHAPGHLGRATKGAAYALRGKV
ncbi:MAG: RagB/SusD family nutrient uptake outer membrane protein, partial [Adhaeribacter sp.]